MARAAVADHAVCGVDGLVGRRRRQAADRQPQGRRHDAVGEILGQALDRRRATRLPRRAARDRARRSSRPPCAPSVTPPVSSAVATAATCAPRLRCARRLLAARATPTIPNGIKAKARSTRIAAAAAADTMIARARIPARRRYASLSLGAVQGAVEEGNQAADPHHRVADCADQPVRIAECQFGQQREQGEGKRHGALNAGVGSSDPVSRRADGQRPHRERIPGRRNPSGTPNRFSIGPPRPPQRSALGT